MVRNSAIVAGVAGGALAAAGAWSLYQRHATETVPYTVVTHVHDVELRRYPEQVLVETVAPSENAAFGRLFRYISGANEGSEELSMTAPVEVDGTGTTIEMTAPVTVERTGRTIPMTAPVETGGDRGADEVRMAFYLPPEYDADSAPRPTDDDVAVVEVPERTLAVRRFSWRATDSRVARETERLLETLETAGVPLAGEPFFMGYDAPWTLPFLRRNEVAVAVEANSGS
ncbi:SOUL family heme-binding protein [Halomicrobium urmianum]|uniref:SOUL family heme-binding protein n=1 Tax=Halomicrobium urmianum TaxID=1586233 RepID=UPI001CD96748|nr:heme-binding protein [Halomicrobium urmianum]